MLPQRHIAEATKRGTLRLEERPTGGGGTYWVILDGDELITVTKTEHEARALLPAGHVP